MEEGIRTIVGGLRCHWGKGASCLLYLKKRDFRNLLLFLNEGGVSVTISVVSKSSIGHFNGAPWGCATAIIFALNQVSDSMNICCM